ncbi:thermonuclease family protein [Metabacillus sp. GX 13764]|uniref:thermonuclease family protein n=1 Tax=Metabacillus kandeliae TaxID=2900151 RepID=UPI001E57FB2E|nr:thermonuclease family protein [Metabacillus kandeliae]MCD7035081.1 thermonuclease family protein [Metabacillus kandeliae]
MKKYLSVMILLCSFFAAGCTAESPAVQKSPDQAESSQSTGGKQESTPADTNSSVQPDEKNLLPAEIVKNVDGDTVKIEVNGKVESVRMLCVDTPETHHPRLGVQPFGPEASAFTAKTLYPGKKIQVELGLGGGRDKYGRLLAYIYADGKMFNEILLEKGLARVAYIYAPNTKYVDSFYAIQKKAQKAGIGIWSIENYAQEDGYHADQQKSPAQKPSVSEKSQKGSRYENNPSDDTEQNASCKGKIKGNANSHIYHVPGGSYYDSFSDNVVWFCSEGAAEKAGYRKAKR